MTVDRASEVLKPCPFCGADAVVEFSGHRNARDILKGFFVVKCQIWSASVSGGYYHGKEADMWEPIEETVGALKAIKRWNRRCGE